MNGKAVGTVALVVIMVGVGVWWGTRSQQPRPAPPPSVPATEERPRVRTTTMDDGATVQKGCLDLGHSIRAALSRGGAIPEGTKLVHLELTPDGVCIAELSKEFLAVSNTGSTGESEAQNALCNALAGFDRVKKLTVKVDGAVFEGEHSGEWSEIPVRDGGSNTDVAR